MVKELKDKRVPRVPRAKKQTNPSDTRDTLKTRDTSHVQIMKGRVVAAKSEKTVTVLIERARMHPMYKKAFAQTSKYLVHTEEPLKEGDLVEIVKVRPISKRKHWIVRKVVGRDLEAIITEELKEEANEAISEVLPEKVEKESSIESQESSEVDNDSKKGGKKS